MESYMLRALGNNPPWALPTLLNHESSFIFKTVKWSSLTLWGGWQEACTKWKIQSKSCFVYPSCLSKKLLDLGGGCGTRRVRVDVGIGQSWVQVMVIPVLVQLVRRWEQFPCQTQWHLMYTTFPFIPKQHTSKRRAQLWLFWIDIKSKPFTFQRRNPGEHSSYHHFLFLPSPTTHLQWNELKELLVLGGRGEGGEGG